MIKIVVLDSGVDITQLPLIGNTVYALEVYEYQGKYTMINSIIDEEQHGSIIIEEIIRGNCSKQIEIYSIKILDNNLKCNIEKLRYALEYVYEKIRPQVLNMSLGYLKEDAEVYILLKKMIACGTMVVAAFDNEEENSYPAKYPDVIGVKGGEGSKDSMIYYDEVNNNIITYNGIRKCYLPGKGYRYIDGNSIACAMITSGIVNILLNEKNVLRQKQIIDIIVRRGIKQEKKKIGKHKRNERILLFPLSTRNIDSICGLEKYCTIVGFLDFRNLVTNSIYLYQRKLEYPIYKNIKDMQNRIDYIYVDEIIEDGVNDKETVYSKLLQMALENGVNISFYDRPSQRLLECYKKEFFKKNISIEFVNVLEEKWI